MNPAELPLVSVCIPSYNRADRLRRAVEALLAGNYPHLEIIISDNASTDHTQRVAEELVRRDGRIRYFRQPENRGMTANFEFARAQATGKYFLWHGDDDYLAPDYISLCVQELERDSSLALAGGLAAYHSGDGVVQRFGNVIRADGRVPIARVLRYLLSVQENCIFCSAYRRERLAACSLPNVLAGDWAWMSQVLLEGRSRVLPQAIVYREAGDSSSANLERIVRMFGVPAWHARHGWLSIPMNVANHVAGSAQPSRSLLARALLWPVLFFPLAIKRGAVELAVAMPFAGRLYRRLFSRRAAQPRP
jgi:glycosyltransferase involved in cell wall biosynthesis